ncbi:MAG: hypothetical protein JWM41_3479 [Gemmatimonadetes bacterium]|nr:hypothetical protein [Gemmatimonadota bacterium]
MTDDVLGALGDVPPGEMRAYLHRMADWIADYRETIETRTIVPHIAPGEVAAGTSARLPDHAEPMSRILGDLDTVVMPGVVHWGHPAFLGYFGSTSNGPALLGELAAAALNVSAMTWKTSPAATELEGVVLEWIRELIGLPPAFTGVVYDTASVATLHALAAAREVSGSEIRARGVAGRADVPLHRVYTSDQAHSSVAKAMVVLGLGEENVVRVPTDDAFRLDARALRAAMEADIALGFRPTAVVATIGTTSTASVDPVADIAELCRTNGVWLHVDAAYGGAFAALPEGRWVMRGVEQADSFVVNPHKWLFVPLDFSALFTRHPDALRSVFSLTPEYLRGDATADGTVVNYMDYGIQLGRRFRALKAWMTFRALGRDGLISRIREHCRLASLLADRATQHPGIALAAPPMMAIVCFRFEPAGTSADETDALNEAVAEAVNASGMAYVTHTRLRGVSCVRVGIGNILTTERHVEQVWSVVLSEAQRLGALR